MECESQIPSFTCSLHPNELIQRVCLNNSDDTALRCLECVLKKEGSQVTMSTLDEFIKNAASQYQNLHRVSAFDSVAPEEFTSFLAQEDEKIQKFSEQVAQEKERVNIEFEKMIQEFTQMCNGKKQEIGRKLDNQISNLKRNYGYYKKTVEKYCHNQHNQENGNMDKEALLLRRMNQCKDVDELEVLIRVIKDDLAETWRPQLQKDQIKEMLKGIAQELQEQSDSVVKTKFSEQANIETCLREFREGMTSLMKNFDQVDNQIPPLSFLNFASIDSEIVKTREGINLLNEWLTPSSKHFGLKLLYRGSRDGMTSEAFHQKCDEYESTLIIARNHLGKIFGGYSDQSWKVINGAPNGYKESYKAWLFSLDEKKKFALKKDGRPFAIYAFKSHGPTFGCSHDLHINFAQDYSSYSKLGFAYEKEAVDEKKKDENFANFDSYGGSRFDSYGEYGFEFAGGLNCDCNILAGAQNFNIEELEIYSVDLKN